MKTIFCSQIHWKQQIINLKKYEINWIYNKSIEFRNNYQQKH